MAIKKDTLDQLLSGRDPKEVFSKDGLFDELKKALAERVLNAELDDHLDGEAVAGKANHRNGYSKKTVLTETSKIDIKIPRDREGTFDPKLIQRYQRRFPGFDEKIVSMYARGMTVREIQGHLLDLYGLEVSPDLVSTITDAVLETVGEWQNRPLEASYPLVFFDALPGQNPGRGPGAQQGCLCRARRYAGWNEGHFGPVDRNLRRRQILAAGHE
jgi:putative transposase